MCWSLYCEITVAGTSIMSDEMSVEIAWVNIELATQYTICGEGIVELDPQCLKLTYGRMVQLIKF